ncbi:MAG: peptide deformylase [Olleya sp.]
MKKSLNVLLIVLIIASCASRKSTKSNNFSDSQINMIIDGDNLQPMRVFKINNKTDSILLRTQSTYVKPDVNDVVLKQFVDRLYATVRDSMSLGVGIAAPQVGILKNIIWVQRFDKDEAPFEVYLNPKIIDYSEKTQIRREGCLSIPNRSETLSSRSKTIVIDYDTMSGEHLTDTVSDFTSVIFQHEIDHLNGILYLDHLDKEIKEAN